MNLLLHACCHNENNQLMILCSTKYYKKHIGKQGHKFPLAVRFLMCGMRACEEVAWRKRMLPSCVGDLAHPFWYTYSCSYSYSDSRSWPAHLQRCAGPGARIRIGVRAGVWVPEERHQIPETNNRSKFPPKRGCTLR